MGTEIVLALGHGDRLVAVDPASARIPGVAGLPEAEPSTAGVFSPDLVLAPAGQELAVRRAAPGAEVLAVEPHDFDEAWDLYRSIGAALGQEEQARGYVRELSRPLAALGAKSFGKRRPRVVAVLSLDPLAIAGGHSFVTDLIELAGGESISHGTEEPRLAWSPEEIVRAGPELALLVSAREPAEHEAALALSLLGPGVRFEPLVLDADRFWLDGAVPVAERLRAWLDALRGSGPDR